MAAASLSTGSRRRSGSTTRIVSNVAFAHAALLTGRPGVRVRRGRPGWGQASADRQPPRSWAGRGARAGTGLAQPASAISGQQCGKCARGPRGLFGLRSQVFGAPKQGQSSCLQLTHVRGIPAAYHSVSRCRCSLWCVTPVSAACRLSKVVGYTLVAEKTVPMLEKNYSVHITSHTDEIIRGTLPDLAPPPADSVAVPLSARRVP